MWLMATIQTIFLRYLPLYCHEPAHRTFLATYWRQNTGGICQQNDNYNAKINKLNMHISAIIIVIDGNNTGDIRAIFTSLLPLLVTWPQQNEEALSKKKRSMPPFFAAGNPSPIGWRFPTYSDWWMYNDAMFSLIKNIVFWLTSLVKSACFLKQTAIS